MANEELKAEIKAILAEIATEAKTPEPPAPADKITVDPLAGIPRFESVMLQKPGGKDKLFIKRSEFGDYYWQIDYADPKTGLKDYRQHRLHWNHQLERLLLTIDKEME